MTLGKDHREEVETAVGRTDVASGTVAENALTFEASEDRRLVAVTVENNTVDATTEVSFSSQMTLDTAGAIDSIASGVLAAVNSDKEVQVRFEDQIAPEWDAGEEISVHVDHQGSGSCLSLVTLHYVPVGDFHRDRLRNR